MNATSGMSECMPSARASALQGVSCQVKINGRVLIIAAAFDWGKEEKGRTEMDSFRK